MSTDDQSTVDGIAEFGIIQDSLECKGNTFHLFHLGTKFQKIKEIIEKKRRRC